VALALEIGDQMAADKAAAAADHDFLGFHNKLRNVADGAAKSMEIYPES
jgi:hypothetical protein